MSGVSLWLLVAIFVLVCVQFYWMLGWQLKQRQWDRERKDRAAKYRATHQDTEPLNTERGPLQ